MVDSRDTNGNLVRKVNCSSSDPSTSAIHQIDNMNNLFVCAFSGGMND
jgi:hypothetical protein